MTLTQNVNDDVYYRLTDENYKEINDYLSSPMSATCFNEPERKTVTNKETITSELIYYWMVAFNIPVDFEKWHLNRLLTLIRICSIKNAPPKKYSKKDVMSRNRALNEARRKKYNSKG